MAWHVRAHLKALAVGRLICAQHVRYRYRTATTGAKSAMITEAAIRKTIREVEAGKKTAGTLADPAPRGAGRLVLIVKPGRAEWYAQRWNAGRRTLQKLGAWPGMGIATARDQHAGVGRTITSGSATVGELFDAYLSTLVGRSAHPQAKALLGEAVGTIGSNRKARDIMPADIVAAIRPIYVRGSICQADRARAYLSAAFGWAAKSDNSYKRTGGQRWGVTRNPVADVERDEDARRVGDHWLRPAEFVALLEWLQAGECRSRTAALLLALTGQRGPQVRAIHASQWDSEARVLSWTAQQMKALKPHSIPVCELAAQVLDRLTPDSEGWLLRKVYRNTVQELLSRSGCGASPQDLRRTWKTLAGAAGLTKSERDQYQAHGVAGDVAERHYNRFDNLPEKRAAVAKWDAWLQEQMRQHRAKKRTQQVVQAQQHARSEQVLPVF